MSKRTIGITISTLDILLATVMYFILITSFLGARGEFSLSPTQNVMSKDVITIAEDAPLEEAACVVADNQIGGIPVMRNDKLTGIITETDLFKVFLKVYTKPLPVHHQYLTLTGPVLCYTFCASLQLV